MTIFGPPVLRDDRSAEFFDAAARDELVTKRCLDCSHWLGLEARTCANCGSSNLDWHKAAGTGELVTWSIVHHPPHPAFGDQVPFAIAYVELSEGPWINARLVGIELDDLRAGLPLQVQFVHPAGDDDLEELCVDLPVTVSSHSRNRGESYPVFAPINREKP